MRIQQKESVVSTQKNRPLLLIIIAVIDLLLGLVMVFMSIVIVMTLLTLLTFSSNPTWASEVVTMFGVSSSSMMFFASMIFILMILTFIFAIGLLYKKRWAIIGRLWLALFLTLYYVYQIFAGTASGGNLLFYYDVFVLLGLSWFSFTQR